MWYKYATTVGLALALLCLASALVLAQEDSPGSRGVVATITALDANTGMATLRTEAGEVVALPKESQWHVGHTVLCDRIETAPRPWIRHCQLWEEGHSGVQSPAPRAGRFADTEPPRRAEQSEPRSAVPASRSETDIRKDIRVFEYRGPVPQDDAGQ